MKMKIEKNEYIREKINEIGIKNVIEALDMYQNYKGKIKNIDVQSNAADLYNKEAKKDRETLVKVKGILKSMMDLINSEL
jgi:hypothetical protein